MRAAWIVATLAAVAVAVVAWRAMEPSVIQVAASDPVDVVRVSIDATGDSLPWPTTIVTTDTHVYRIRGGYVCQGCKGSEDAFTVKSVTNYMIVLALKPEQVKEWHREDVAR